MKVVVPNEKVVNELISNDVDDKPIVMVNLLKFKDMADYTDLDKNHKDYCKEVSGERAYQKYSKEVVKILWGIGGQILWLGKVRASLISPEGEEWDEVILVYYPSREAFMRMVTCEAYQEIVHHRTAALENSRLIETKMKKLPKVILSVVKGVFRLTSMIKPSATSINFDALKRL